MPKKTCENCLFSSGPWKKKLPKKTSRDYESFANFGSERHPFVYRYTCRRKPPTDGWPTVKAGDWCAQWQDEEYAPDEWS